MKKYKAVKPEITIRVIKQILEDCGIITKENYVDNIKFQSCRIAIGNSDLSPLNIGTNGKGRSFEYSLASGYAEFMERLQNNILLYNKKYATKDFIKNKPASYIKRLNDEDLIFENYYDENEKFATIDEVIEEAGNMLIPLIKLESKQELYNYLLTKFGKEHFLMVPFYSVFEKKEVYLPIDVVLSATGSNGMAAGNTNIEAILQAFCEIFERYAVAKIHNGELTPPTIPFEYFKEKHVYEELKYIEEHSDYKLIIKDCSLGEGFPVIGLIIIDTKNQRYNFKIGADFIPEIALERTITEVYQGVKYFSSIPFELLTLKEIASKYSENSTKINLEKIFVNGSGLWPLSILDDQDSYEFKGFNETLGRSDEVDLKYSLELVKKMGSEIYIRNSSQLGFPSFYAVIPSLSQIVEHEVNNSYHNPFSEITRIRQLGSIDKSKAIKLSMIIDDSYQTMKSRNVNYTKFYIPNINQDLQDLDVELLEFMLLYYLRDYKKAINYLKFFLQDKDPYIYQYYYSIYDFVNLKWIKKIAPSSIKSVLDLKYSEDLRKELFEDFDNPDMIFQDYRFPNCFHCDNCDIQEDCSLFASLRIEKNIEKIAAKRIKQSDLIYEFENIM
jgi:ribosomal protein S12 methylthiotransferase accessory factor